MVELVPAMRPGAPLVVLNGQAGEGNRVADAVRRQTDADFSLAAVEVRDWGRDLTPWPAPPAFGGDEPYGGGADAYLRELTERILPEILRALPAEPAFAALVGYSLAGLFALYAPFRTDAFARIASVSGSLWYPGFEAFARESAWARRPDCVYLSLGDREARTRNPAIAPVERNTRALAEFLTAQCIPTTLEMNPGGHFDHPDLRLARGVARLLAGRADSED